MTVKQKESQTLHVEDILKAYQQLKDVVAHTPLQKNERVVRKIWLPCVY